MKLKRRTKGAGRILTLHFWGVRTVSLVLMGLSLVLFFVSGINPDSFQKTRIGVADMAAPLLSSVTAPIQQAADYVRIVTGIAGLQEENARLLEENERLREWHQLALQLQAQHDSLQDLLNIKLPEAYGYVTARVIADSGNAYVKSLLVLAGEQDGIVAGQAVLAADGLAGRVLEAGDSASRLLLLTDINSRVPVLVGEGNARAVLAGQNDGLPVLLYLPADADIKDGQNVMTSGHDGLFPPGLPVGTAHRDESGKVFVRTFADLDRLQYVRAIDKGGDRNLRLGSFSPGQ